MFGIRRASAAKPDSVSAGMSFRLTGDLPERAICLGDLRSVGPCHGENVYAVGRRLGPSEEAAARIAKGSLIGRGVLSQRGWRDSIAPARAAAEALLSLPDSETARLVSYLVAHDTVGFGPFSILMEDSDNIEEIVVNRPTSNLSVYHSKLGFCKTNLAFESEGSMRLMLNKLIASAEKELNSDTPIIDAQVEGSRVHAQLRPFAVNGPVVSIRLNSSAKVDLKRLLSWGTAVPEVFAYLWMALEAGMNIVISGPPASGKTSLMLSAAVLLPRYERVLVIEDEASELMLGDGFPNFVNLQSRKGSSAGLGQQVVNALHMRPDRLVIGELRGSEAGEVFSAGNLGMPFMTTMHSDVYGLDLLDRLKARPMCVGPESVSALDMAVFMERSGQKRSIRRICEYNWAVKNDISMEAAGYRPCSVSDVFDSETGMDSFRESKALARFAARKLITQQRAATELRRRSRFLSAIVESDKSSGEYMRGYGV